MQKWLDIFGAEVVGAFGTEETDDVGSELLEDVIVGGSVTVDIWDGCTVGVAVVSSWRKMFKAELNRLDRYKS